MLTGPFSPLFGPFFRAKRAGPARLGPLRAGLGQKLKPAGSAGPARFWPGFTGPGPGRAGPFGHLYLALSGPVHPRVLDCSECNNVTGRYARSTTIIRHVHGYLLPITSLLFAAKNTNNVRMHLALEDFDSGVRVSGYYLCNFYCHVK